MADIYVDPTAATNGSGSQASPRNIWPTSISANDTINLKGGTRLTVSAQLSLGAGSNNIVRGYYPAGPAPRPIITSTAANQALISVGVAGVTTFEGIHFDECRNMAANGGVIGTAVVAAARHANLSIRGCRFTGIGINAILLNGTTTANVSSTFECIGNEFDDIGADCVFGGALNYVFAYNRCTRMSAGGANGDGVGYINADPDFVHIHHNYIDHSATDSKQCIIIDTTTPGTGIALIEDNILIGFGSASAGPSVHTVVISDPVTTFRRNVVYTYGLTCGVNWAGDRVTDNVFVIGNSTGSIVTAVADGRFTGNTFVAIKALSADHAAITLGTGATSAAVVRNNLFLDVTTAVRSNVVGQNPTMSNNAYRGVTTRRTGTSGAFAEATEVTADALLATDYRPTPGSVLLGAGAHLGYGRDASGHQRPNPPSIGAYDVATFQTFPTTDPAG